MLAREDTPKYKRSQRRSTSTARADGDSILPLSTGRSYGNAIDSDATDKVRAAFGAANYDRLVAVNDRYDPDHVFHANQCVRPSGG